MKGFYGYECFSGCGHTTITNKYYKFKKMHCAVCGTKETMEYVGEYKVEPVKKHVLDLGLNNGGNM